jgi:hypothetical protein
MKFSYKVAPTWQTEWRAAFAKPTPLKVLAKPRWASALRTGASGLNPDVCSDTSLYQALRFDDDLPVLRSAWLSRIVLPKLLLQTSLLPQFLDFHRTIRVGRVTKAVSNTF